MKERKKERITEWNEKKRKKKKRNELENASFFLFILNFGKEPFLISFWPKAGRVFATRPLPLVNKSAWWLTRRETKCSQRKSDISHRMTTGRSFGKQLLKADRLIPEESTLTAVAIRDPSCTLSPAYKAMSKSNPWFPVCSIDSFFFFFPLLFEK